MRLTPARTLLHGFRSTAVLALTVCLLWSWQLSSARADGIALVTDLAGKAVDVLSGRPATILTEIQPGMQVRLDGGSRMVVLYIESGTEYIFSGPAHMEFLDSAPRMRNGPDPQKRASPFGGGAALKTGNLTQAAFVMRGSRGTPAIKLLNLVGTTTLEVRPEFRWAPIEGASTYRLELSDGAGRILLEHTTDANAYRLPESIELEAGMPYTWEVSTRTREGRRYVSAGDFTVADNAVRQEVETLRPSNGAPFSARVAFAAWLGGAGLRDEAREYWKILASERPSDPKLRALAEP